MLTVTPIALIVFGSSVIATALAVLALIQLQPLLVAPGAPVRGRCADSIALRHFSDFRCLLGRTVTLACARLQALAGFIFTIQYGSYRLWRRAHMLGLKALVAAM